MSAELPSDKDIEAHHARFQELTKRIVRQDIQSTADATRRSWIVCCYRSIETFEATFPLPDEREEMLSELERLDRETDEALAVWMGILPDDFDMPTEGNGEKLDEESEEEWGFG